MKKFHIEFSSTFLFILLLLTSCKDTPAQQIEIFENCLVLENEAITLQIDTAFGGRIASLQYQGVEILSQIKDENNWYWGSTVWPAPQSDWNWPPPDKLDRGAYTVKTQNDAVIILESPKDAYKNIQVRKRFQFIDEHRLSINYSFFNWGDTTLSVGIWENTRVPYQGQVRWKTGKKIEGTISGLNQQDSLSFFDLKNHTKPHKLFIESEGGWISHYREGIVFTKSFQPISIDRIPPEQAQIEVYFDPVNKFAELEEHGPYMTLAPSTVSTLKVIWTLGKE